MVYVIALLKAHEDGIDKLIAAFQKAAPAVKRKAGCLGYRLTRHIDSNLDGQLPADPDMLVIMETWADLASLDAHLSDREYREWYRSIHTLLAGVGMQILGPVAGDAD